MRRQLSRDEFLGEWSQLHGNAPITGIVKAWLLISYALTKPIIKLRISPNLLSFLSVVTGLIFVFSIESHLAIILLVLSLLLDGIDGTVAICTGKSSRFGAILDAVADRIVEVCWAISFYLMGAPWVLVILAWSAAFIQEYMRARAGGLGLSELLIVTWAERPVRATVIFIPLIGRLIGIDVFTFAAALWALLQVMSVIVLFSLIRSQLRQSRR